MIETARVSFPGDDVTIRRYGPNDYEVYFDNGDYSFRGTLQDVMQEISDNIPQLSKATMP